MLVRIEFPYDTIVSEQDYEKIVSLAGEEVSKRGAVIVAREDGRLTTYSDTFMTYDVSVKAGELVTPIIGYVALATDRSFIVDLLELYAAVPMKVILCSFLKPVTQELNNIEVIKKHAVEYYRLNEEDTFMNTNYKQYVFYIDGIKEQFVGFTAGSLWNGWECPAFEKEAAERILAQAESDAAYVWSYDEETDTIKYTDNEGEPYKDCQGIKIQHHGKELTVYSIGSWAWTWNKVSDLTLDELHTQMAEKLKALRDAAQALDMFWNHGIPDKTRAVLETNYPFDKSFDEIACDIEAWYDNFVEVTTE